MAIQEDTLVFHPDVISRNPDHTLDECLPDVDGVAKDDDVASLYVLVGQQVLGEPSGRSVRQLIHEQMVANEQRIFHRSGGDDERLHQRRRTEQQQNDGDGPFSNHAAWNVALPRLFGLLRSLLGHAGLFLTHDKTIVSESITSQPIATGAPERGRAAAAVWYSVKA